MMMAYHCSKCADTYDWMPHAEECEGFKLRREPAKKKKGRETVKKEAVVKAEIPSVRSEIVARKMNAKKKHSDAGKKAWDTIRKNEKRSEASKKAWETRRAKQGKTEPSQEPMTIVSPPLPLTDAERKRIRSEASKKAWETRRANERKANISGDLDDYEYWRHFNVDKNGYYYMTTYSGKKKRYDVYNIYGDMNGGE